MTPNMQLDKTNFLQSLMHMIKGNFGTGILAMPASFSHCGLVNAIIGLPLLCLVATYCVHLLVRSSQHLENKLKSCSSTLEYSELAKGSFITGPKWIRPFSGIMCKLVDLILIVCQLGICCVYLVFIVENLTAILFNLCRIDIAKNYLFLMILAPTLLMASIRTLRRLAIASACANFLQVTGICIILEYLLRDMPSEPKVDLFRPASEVALGFGSAMFAFEGISVVMPIYTRMKRQEQMGGQCGIINLSYFILLCLYFAVGLFGYLRFGRSAEGSITLNLPTEPLYELVRLMFAISVFLSYPLQFHVLNETIWNWFSGKFLTSKRGLQINRAQQQRTIEDRGQAKSTDSSILPTTPDNQPSSSDDKQQQQQQQLQNPSLNGEQSKYEYCCRMVLVMLTFIIAMCVPRLNLMMDFFGSISGTSLSITLPPLIHLVAFWEDTSGRSRYFLAILDISIIIFGLVASANGSYFSLIEIIESFKKYPLHSF